MQNVKRSKSLVKKLLIMYVAITKTKCTLLRKFHMVSASMSWITLHHRTQYSFNISGINASVMERWNAIHGEPNMVSVPMS